MYSVPSPQVENEEEELRRFPREKFEETCFRALGLIDRNREYLESHLQRSGGDAKALQALEDVAVASNRLERTLAEMMALLRCLQGQAEPALRQIDLRGLLDELCAGREEIRRCIGVELTLDCGELETCYVLADRTYLEQICLHLLSNALRACRPGGHVAATLRPEGTGWRLSIADDGCGLPDERPEEQRENHRCFLGGAQGGLLLCGEYCRLMGWTLTLTGRPEGGAEAVVRISDCIQSERPSGQIQLRSEDVWEQAQLRCRLRRLISRELHTVPGLENAKLET